MRESNQHVEARPQGGPPRLRRSVKEQMLREPFIRSLARSFPIGNFKFHDEANRIASLPMPNGQGELSIHDDGDELTFFLGDITHCHFSQEYLGDGKYSPEAEAIEEAIDYLRDLFSDQVVFYRARKIRSGLKRSRSHGMCRGRSVLFRSCSIPPCTSISGRGGRAMPSMPFRPSSRITGWSLHWRRVRR